MRLGGSSASSGARPISASASRSRPIPPLLMAAFRWIFAGPLLIGACAARRADPAVGAGRRCAARRAAARLRQRRRGLGRADGAERPRPRCSSPSCRSGWSASTRPSADWRAPAHLGGRRARGRLPRDRPAGLAGAARWATAGARFSGVVATQIACVGWAIGSCYARRRDISAATIRACGRVRDAVRRCAAARRAACSGEWRRWRSCGSSIAARYLIIVGAIGGFTAYPYALKHLPVATVFVVCLRQPGDCGRARDVGARRAVRRRMAWRRRGPAAWRSWGRNDSGQRPTAGLGRDRPSGDTNVSGSNDASTADQPHQEQHDRRSPAGRR